MLEEILKEDDINILVSSKELYDKVKSGKREVDVFDDEVDAKRYYHYVIIDRDFDIKSLFRALRNGGYLISFVDLDYDQLYDIGFSAINKLDNMIVAKKVHSWNDW